jgi:DNA-directed RNA polymerase sigma subunit (sigma70/sigma32)
MDDDPLACGDPVKVYVDEMARVPAMSPEEEMDCVRQIREGGECADECEARLVEGSLMLVVSIAERHRNDRIHILDLIQAGNNGLMGALRTFRESSEKSFPAYAAPIVERAIVEAASAKAS